MFIKKAISFVLCAFLLTACVSQEARPLGSSDPTEESESETPEESLEKWAEEAPAYLQIMVEGILYTTGMNDSPKKYDTEKMKYLGEITHIDPFLPGDEFHSNWFNVGTKIYRYDDETLYAEYEGGYLLNKKHITNWLLPPFAFVEGKLYVFWRDDDLKKHDTEKMKYLGDVVYSENVTPKEEFHSTCFSVGTKIYRFDDETLYAEFESECRFGIEYFDDEEKDYDGFYNPRDYNNAVGKDYSVITEDSQTDVTDVEAQITE